MTFGELEVGDKIYRIDYKYGTIETLHVLSIKQRTHHIQIEFGADNYGKLYTSIDYADAMNCSKRINEFIWYVVSLDIKDVHRFIPFKLLDI